MSETLIPSISSSSLKNLKNSTVEKKKSRFADELFHDKQTRKLDENRIKQEIQQKKDELKRIREKKLADKQLAIELSEKKRIDRENRKKELAKQKTELEIIKNNENITMLENKLTTLKKMSAKLIDKKKTTTPELQKMQNAVELAKEKMQSRLNNKKKEIQNKINSLNNNIMKIQKKIDAINNHAPAELDKLQNKINNSYNRRMKIVSEKIRINKKLDTRINYIDSEINQITLKLSKLKKL